MGTDTEGGPIWRTKMREAGEAKDAEGRDSVDGGGGVVVWQVGSNLAKQPGRCLGMYFGTQDAPIVRLKRVVN